MKFQRKKVVTWVLVGLALVPLVILMAWSIQDFSRTIIVLPASQILWMMRQLFDSTPQIFFWLALMILVGVLIGKSFSKPEVDIKDETPRDPLVPRRSRVNFWLLQLYHQDEYHQTRLVEFVDRLAIDVLTYVHRLPSWQIEQRLVNGEIEIPPTLNTFLKLKQQSLYSRRIPSMLWLKSIWVRVKSFFQKTPPDTAVSPRDYEMGVVLDYLEKQLEIHHDSTHL
jgi:hypothetical protein